MGESFRDVKRPVVLLLDAPRVIVVCAFLFAPGVIWALLAYPSPSRVIRLAVGLALGIALQVTLAAPLAATARITAASVTISTLLALLAATALGWEMRVRAPRPPSHASARRREAAWLAAVIAAGVVVCAAPLARWSIPDGWDPSAHSLLASVIIRTGELPTWRPFEPINSNYPYGAHVLMADVSLLSGLAPDKVFASLLCVISPALAMLLIYALARRMWRRGDVAVAAAAAYGLLGYAGSVQYGSWGGLPNALGLILLLATLEPLLAPGYTRRRVVAAGFLLGAAALTHHQVALTAALTLGAFLVALAVSLALRWRQPAARSALQRQLARGVAVCGLGMLLASYPLAPYVIQGVQSASGTEAFADFHEYSGWPFDKNGVVLWLAATLGVSLALAGAWRRAPISAKATPMPARLHLLLARFLAPSVARRAQLFAGIALAALFAAFIFGQFIFHDIIWALYRKDETAFSPDRFLTDMTYFLALFAAPALAWLCNLSWRFVIAGPLVARQAWLWTPRLALAAGALAVAVASLRASGALRAGAGQLHGGDLAAFIWVRAHTPANTLVVALTPNDDKWAPYFTQRESYYTPLPASEDTADYVAEKRAIIGAELAALDATPRLRLVALGSEGSAWAALAKRPVAVIANQPILALGAPAFTTPGAYVYTLSSLESLAPGAAPTPTMTLAWSMSPGALRAHGSSLASGHGVWISSKANVAGPDGARWLMMWLPGALAPGAAVVCHAEDGAQLWVDGVYQPRACYATITPLPALTKPGPHVISVSIWRNAHSAPWADVTLLEQAS